MSVWIEQVAVENMGPLGERTFDLGRFNLIYGLNETGKTFLVEFLLQSLFRHASEWSLRELPGRGKVILNGLGENKKDFAPTTRKKLEDYWEENESGLPLNMARLLVVKGGELALSSDTPGGVDRDVLKKVLSQEVLLDQILGLILKTTQEAIIENREIKGTKMGKIKQRLQLSERKRQVSDLFDEVEARYSQGPIRSLELQKEEIELSLDKQRQAKRHLAYQLDKKINKLNTKRIQIPDDELEKPQNDLRDHERISNEITGWKEELQEKTEATQNFRWLKQAIQVWESQKLGKIHKASLVYLILGIFSLLIGFGTGLLDLVLAAAPLFLIGLGLIGVYLWRLHQWAKKAVENEERQSIQKEYKERFEASLGGLADLQVRLETLRKENYAAEELQKRIEKNRSKQDEFATKIKHQLQTLTGKEIDKTVWQSTVKELRQLVRSIDHKIQKLNLQLEGLAVDQSDYISEPVNVQFSKERMETLESELSEIENDLHDAQNDMKGLKQLVCNVTGDKISGPWTQILLHLRNRREEANRDYQQLTAEILAKIGVAQVLKEIRSQEDEKISRGLKAEEVTSILSNVTGSYDVLDLVENQLVVSGQYGNYPLNQLSTGAREQVQLALRIGFATRLAGGQPLFLILDDAFQHSDWERRGRLFANIIELAKSGWQITYLTMDDHIRDLCCEMGENAFGDQFRFEII